MRSILLFALVLTGCGGDDHEALSSENGRCDYRASDGRSVECVDSTCTCLDGDGTWLGQLDQQLDACATPDALPNLIARCPASFVMRPDAAPPVDPRRAVLGRWSGSQTTTMFLDGAKVRTIEDEAIQLVLEEGRAPGSYELTGIRCAVPFEPREGDESTFELKATTCTADGIEMTIDGGHLTRSGDRALFGTYYGTATDRENMLELETELEVTR